MPAVDSFCFLAIGPVGHRLLLWTKPGKSSSEKTEELAEHPNLKLIAPEVWALPVETGEGDILAAPRTNGRPPPGAPRFRLSESTTYYWQVEGQNPTCEWLFGAPQLTQNIFGPGTGTLRPVNRLGHSSVTICGGRPVPFEVIPDRAKLSYDDEYERLVGDIADVCSELLLEGGAATGVSGSTANDRAQTALVPFLFLRNRLRDLDAWIEHIDRNPHRALTDEGSWRMPWDADPADLGRDPFRFGRGWHDANGRPRPSEGYARRRRESLDTPPNRFVVHALASFAQACAKVRDLCRPKPGKRGGASALLLQAERLHARLERARSLPLFSEVGAMRMVPIGNQTLQKREGYRQILEAWIRHRASLSVTWDGYFEKDDGAYDVRSVAALYEYWLFFRLDAILRSKEIGLIPIESDNPDEAYNKPQGGLHIRLAKGRRSSKRYHRKGTPEFPCPMTVELFYEREFKKSPPHERGSYSRSFKPDFTLAIYPTRFATHGEDSEKAASEAGQIVYLHFDAKYRIESVESALGKPDDGYGEGGTLEEEDDEEAAGVHKRADLLKMHTYNDAIRRTAGSYVLFPGPDLDVSESPEEWVRYRDPSLGGNGSAYLASRYYEILPGVGAFPMRPGSNTTSSKVLEAFLKDVINHHATRFTDLDRAIEAENANIAFSRRLRDADNETYSPHTVDKAAETVAVIDAFIRPGEAWQICLDEGWFFCQATDAAGIPVEQDGRIFSARWLMPYKGPEEGPREYEAVIYPGVRYAGMVAREELQQRLGASAGLLQSQAREYHLFRFDPSCPCPVTTQSIYAGDKPHRPAMIELQGPIERPAT